MSVGDVAGLIAAIAFVLLVGVLAVPLIKLGRVLDEARRLVGSVTDQTVPLMTEVTTTVEHTNHQLERVDAITANVEQLTTNVAGLSSLFAATLGGPLVRVASFSYGVRRAMSGRRRADLERRVKSAAKAERKAGPAARGEAPGASGTAAATKAHAGTNAGAGRAGRTGRAARGARRGAGSAGNTAGAHGTDTAA